MVLIWRNNGFTQKINSQTGYWLMLVTFPYFSGPGKPATGKPQTEDVWDISPEKMFVDLGRKCYECK